MRRTRKRTKSKQQGRVRDLKPVKEVKSSGKIEHAAERHETAVTEDGKELKKFREEIEQIKSDIAHILEALQTLQMWVPMSRAEIPQYAWAYGKFVDITTRLRREARSGNAGSLFSTNGFKSSYSTRPEPHRTICTALAHTVTSANPR
jgi:hypothetical protein